MKINESQERTINLRLLKTLFEDTILHFQFDLASLAFLKIGTMVAVMLMDGDCKYNNGNDNGYKDIGKVKKSFIRRGDNNR